MIVPEKGMTMAKSLSERQEKLLVLFKDAISREQEAQQMYTEASRLCDDPELKALLESFAKEEAHHEEMLMRIYRELRTVGSFKSAA